MGMSCCLRWRDLSSRVRDGYILGLAATRGHARRLATPRRPWSTVSIAANNSQKCLQQYVSVLPTLARKRAPPSLERGSFGSARERGCGRRAAAAVGPRDELDASAAVTGLGALPL